MDSHSLPQNDTVLSPSPEMFSFPGTPTEVDIRGSDDFRNSTSPADQFFLNGKLLPHEFPTSVTPTSRPSFSGKDNIANVSNVVVNLSRGTSVGSSSISMSMSKDSLTSSRSNSTNSSSTWSTCSSARTSSSDVSERRGFEKRLMRRGNSVNSSGLSSGSGLGQFGYRFGGSTRRWQFIAPAPMLGPSRSRRGPTGSPRIKKRDQKRSNSGSNGNEIGGFFNRVLRSLICGDL